MLGVPEARGLQVVGHVLLNDEMAGEVVAVLISVAIAQLLHQRRGGVAQMERNGKVARLADQSQRGVDAQIGGVALGACGQIDGCLGERYASLGPSQLVHGVEGGIGQKERVGVGESHVLGGADDQPSGDELGVFASFNHACHPIEGGIGVASANALDEGRDDVVVHLAILVVGQGILLQAVDHHVVCDFDIALASGLYHQLEDVEQLARVSPAIAKQGVGLADLDMALLELHVFGQGAMEQLQEVVFLQGLEHIELATREQGAYDLERGVLGGGSYERDVSALDSSQERVLLRLAEPMDFVDEEDGRRGGEEAVVLCPVDDVAHVFHAAGDGTQGVEGNLELMCDDLRQRGLPHTRRSPEDERGYPSCVNHLAQDGPLAHQMFLPDVFVERAWAHSFGQRCAHNGTKIRKSSEREALL